MEPFPLAMLAVIRTSTYEFICLQCMPAQGADGVSLREKGCMYLIQQWDMQRARSALRNFITHLSLIHLAKLSQSKVTIS
jgi:hypothetical protein